MNESRWDDGFSKKDRSKKFIFKKKLDVFEHRANGMILRSAFSNETPTTMANHGCSSIGFPIEISTISTKIRLFCVQRSLTFFLKMNFFDRSFLKHPSFQRDSFIFRVFYDRSNSAKGFLEKCLSCP